MNYRILITIFSFYIFFSCNSSKKNEISILKTKSFVTDFNSLYYTQVVKQNNGLSKIYYLDIIHNKIYSYKSTDFKIVDSINLSNYKQLYNVKGLVGRFYVVDSNNFYLLSSNLKQVYHIREGVLNVINFPNKIKETLFIGSKWFHVIDNKLYLNGYINTLSNSNKLNKQELIATLNSKDEIIELYNSTPSFPDIYLDGNNYNDLSTNYISKCVNGRNESIYSFPIEHNLFIYENNRFVKKTDAKSKFLNEFITTPDNLLLDIQHTMKLYITAPYYREVIYDRYRNLYYRVADIENDKIKDNGKQQLFSDKNWGLIILNDKFNIINEIQFSNKTNLAGILPVKEGLLIINSTRKDKLVLDLYEVK
jgi:hypothetical protein